MFTLDGSAGLALRRQVAGRRSLRARRVIGGEPGATIAKLEKNNGPPTAAEVGQLELAGRLRGGSGTI
jgi:hypothetical protein